MLFIKKLFNEYREWKKRREEDCGSATQKKQDIPARVIPCDEQLQAEQDELPRDQRVEEARASAAATVFPASTAPGSIA